MDQIRIHQETLEVNDLKYNNPNPHSTLEFAGAWDQNLPRIVKIHKH